MDAGMGGMIARFICVVVVVFTLLAVLGATYETRGYGTVLMVAAAFVLVYIAGRVSADE